MGSREEACDWIGSLQAGDSWEALKEIYREIFIGRSSVLGYIKKMAKYSYTEGSLLNYLDKMKSWSLRALLPKMCWSLRY